MAENERQQDVIDEFWRLQVRKSLAQEKEAKSIHRKLQRKIDNLERLVREVKIESAELTMEENRQQFEEAGRNVEQRILETGDCDFEYLDGYFSLSEEYQKAEEKHWEEEQMELERERWERQLDGLIELVKKENPVEEVR